MKPYFCFCLNSVKITEEPSGLLNSKQFRNKEIGDSNSFRWSSFVVKVLDDLIQSIK